MNYKIQLEIKGIYNETFTEENISLGTSIKETLDKTYDMITLELLLLDKQEEYQPYTPVTINIYESNEDGSLKNSINYNMIIESDEVDDIYIGRNTKYTHKLVLIEETKLLETEVMPNITFTQPVVNISPDSIEFIDTITYIDPYSTNPANGVKFKLTHNIPENKPLKKLYPGARIPNISATLMSSLNDMSFTNGGYITIYPSSVKIININTNVEYELTSPSTLEKKSPEKEYGDNIFKVKVSEHSGDLLIPDNIIPGEYKAVYKYNVIDFYWHNITWWPFSSPMEKHTDSSIFDYPFAGVIQDVETSPTMPTSTTVKQFYNNYSDVEIKTFTVVSIEEGVRQSDPIYLDYVLDQIEAQTVLKDKFISRNSEEELSDGNVTPDIKIPDGENRQLSVTLDIERLEKTVLPPVVKTKFYFYAENGSLISEETKRNTLVLQPKSKTLYINLSIPKDAVKYIAVVDIPSYSVKSYRNSISQSHPPKYRFSDKIKGIASSIVAPEYTFEKKTLWEICLEIGEMFNGIPTLNNGVIDFLILDDREPIDFNQTKEAESKSSNMTNYATKLYTSELKNIIQDESFDESKTFSVYPSPNSWVRVRASDYNTTSIDRQTSALVIDNEQSGIYKIRKVLCRYKEKEYNITEYVLEKSIFESLSSEVSSSFIKATGHECSEKGTRAYYERGKNCIYNLAQLPENGSVVGWKQTHLTIQYILFLKFGILLTDSSRDIFDYEFRIEYYPYHSRMNISKQTNLNGIYNQVTSNFNQTSNNVSALQFSKHAEETLNKLGNPEITTRYTTPDLMDGIKVGDCLVLNGRNYYINQKLTTINNTDKTVVLNLTKDNYKQDTRIAVSREYRQYNIDSSNILRKTLSKPYSVIISTEEVSLTEDTTYIGDSNSSNRRTIGKSIVDTLSPKYYGLNKISNAFVHVQNYDGTPLQYNTYRTDVSASTCGNKILPVIGDVLGNTMTFQWDMYDNYSAGRQIRNPNKDTRSWWDNLTVEIGGVVIKEKDYGLKIQDDCRYCDDNGATPSVHTVFFSNNQFELPYGTSDTLPETGVTQEGISQYGECMLSTTFDACKDSREALSFQMTVSMQTFDKDIRIFNIFKYNPLVSNAKSSAPKWYGYTKDNIPADSQYYRFNSSYVLSDVTYNSTKDTSSLTTVVKVMGQNKSNNDYLGYILCYDNGEVLLDIRKPLKSKAWANVFFNIFNDEINLRDTVYVEDTEPLIDIRDYTPIIYPDETGKLFIDLDNIKTVTGLNPIGLKISLGTLHNTQARGIQDGYHGRTYSKSEDKDKSLYRVGNNWEYGEEVFTKIYTNNSGELLFDTKTTTGNNVQSYIDQKQISKQDLSVNKKTGESHNTLKYGITLGYKGLTSSVSNMETVTFDSTSRLPLTRTFD